MKVRLVNPETSDSDAGHDAWFRAQVKAAFDGLKDSTNPIIPDAEWRQWVAEKRASLQSLKGS